MKFAFKSFVPHLILFLLHTANAVQKFCIITVKLGKMWIKETFKEYYCVARKKSITCEKTGPQTSAINGCGFEVFFLVLNFIVIGSVYN